MGELDLETEAGSSALAEPIVNPIGGSSMTRAQARSVPLLLALCIPAASFAVSDADVEALRRELAAMRDTYEARIGALEARVEAAEASAAARPGSPPAAAQASSSAFNPAMSVILQGRAAGFGRPEGHRDIPGFLIGGETGVGPEGLSLSETEIDFSANVDDLFYGFASIALNQENAETEIELEEVYLQTLALPEGFTLKGGQFLSGIGYLNTKHSHAWDFVDTPLAYEAMLNTQLLDTGVQLNWVAPTDTYLQLGAEILRGEGFPGGGGAHDGLGSGSLFGKLGGEVGDSHTWQAGLAWLRTRPRGRESSDALGNLYVFDGSSDMLIADFVWKWAPDGNYRERNVILQAEYLHRWEDGSLELISPNGSFVEAYRGDQDGFYGQVVYQFMPRWRAGLRYDHVWSDNRSDLPGLPRGDASQRASLMVDFSHTEFSRLRLQWNHDMGGIRGDDAVFLQYIMSLGSHGAHTF